MHFKKTICVLSFFLLGFVLGAEIPTKDSDRSDFKRSFEKECATSYSATCLKLDIVQWVDKLSDSGEFSVLPGVSVVKDGSVQEKTNEVVAELAREFPNDPDARLDAYLMKKVTGYLGSHSLKLNLFDSKTAQDVVSAREKGGFGGGKGDKKGGMGMLLMAGAMMKGTLMTIALGALAAIAGKALITGLISLMLSAIIGLKSLAGGQHHQTTYEVHAKPVHTSHHSYHEEHAGGHGGGGGGYGGYGRSFNEALPAGLQPSYKPY